LLSSTGSSATSDWNAVFTRAVNLAWFAPVSAIVVAYVASNSVKVTAPALTPLVDILDINPS